MKPKIIIDLYKMQNIKLINSEKGRYYQISIIQNLFDEYELNITRGSKNRRIYKHVWCNTLKDAITKYEKLVILRIRHGYVEYCPIN